MSYARHLQDLIPGWQFADGDGTVIMSGPRVLWSDAYVYWLAGTVLEAIAAGPVYWTQPVRVCRNEQWVSEGVLVFSYENREDNDGVGLDNSGSDVRGRRAVYWHGGHHADDV